MEIWRIWIHDINPETGRTRSRMFAESNSRPMIEEDWKRAFKEYPEAEISLRKTKQ